MFYNCGTSFCRFFKKIFRINNNRIKELHNINTSKRNRSNVIDSNDLNKYLFADECELVDIKIYKIYKN